MLKPKAGDLVRLHSLVVRDVDGDGFYNLDVGGYTVMAPPTVIAEILPRPLAVGDRVFLSAGTGTAAQCHAGRILAIDGHESWVKWDGAGRGNVDTGRLQREEETEK